MKNSLLIMITSIVPVLFYMYRIGKKQNMKKLIIYSILFTLLITFALSVVDVSFRTINIEELIKMTFGIIISVLLNILLLSNNINIKKVPKTILVFILFFFISIIQLIPMGIFNLDINNLDIVTNIRLTLFSDTVLLLTLLYLYRENIKDSFVNFKKNFYFIFETSFKIWFIGFIGMFVFNILISLFIKGAVPNNENSVQEMISIAPIISFICAGLMAPFIEELTFRKSLKDVIKNKWGFILFSGILFGSMHVVLSIKTVYDLAYLIPYSCLGISFAYMYYKTDNIFSSIMMHLIHNSAIILFSFLTGMIIL